MNQCHRRTSRRRRQRPTSLILIATTSCLVTTQHLGDVLHYLQPNRNGDSSTIRGYHVFITGVQGALPEKNTIYGGAKGNRSDRSNLSNALYSRRSVALRDSFPCESEQRQPSSPPASSESGTATATINQRGAAVASSAPKGYLRTNSFAAQNNILATPANAISSSSSLSPRGGAVDALPSAASALDDDELDQMVEALISGLENDNEDEREEKDEDDDWSVDDASLVDDKSESKKGDEVLGCKTTKQDFDHNADEAEKEEDKSDEMEETDADSSFSTVVPQDDPSLSSPPSSSDTSSTSESKVFTYLTGTPTNAYYRFLVRRGPKGHILASISLILIQWTYIYLPALYKTLATILLKLRIYDPRILYEKDRQRQRLKRYGPPPKKQGFASKLLFGTSSTKTGQVSKKARQQQQQQQQKRADQEATSKLQQLYKTMKVGGTDCFSEVKHNYLSIGFMKRHGLGKDYRVEKPRIFMGEVVGDGRELSEGQRDEEMFEEEDVLFSDGEHLEKERSSVLKIAKETQQQQRAKTKKANGWSNDWVVKAFSLPRHRSKPPAMIRNEDSKESSSSNYSLWDTVKHSAILDAAKESLTAERGATAQKYEKRTSSARDGSSTSNHIENTLNNNGSSSGASTMLQSVMTRVGSGNGRIFGAYPNDAPPLHACAHKRGVVQLARRYGYGDWGQAEVDSDDETDCGSGAMQDGNESEDAESCWGGGDLFLDGVDSDGLDRPEDLITSSRSRKKTSRRGSRRRQRREKKKPLKGVNPIRTDS